jgi:hypothetical protein
MPEEPVSRLTDSRPVRQAVRRIRRSKRLVPQAAAVVLADDLPPALKQRVRLLLKDLSADDISMALLDLAHLYRGVAGISNRTVKPMDGNGKDPPTVLIYSEDGTAVANVCSGPDGSGNCPRAQEDSVACADRWLMASAWMFKVAPEANVCPLIPLGLGQPSVAPAARSKMPGPSSSQAVLNESLHPGFVA